MVYGRPQIVSLCVKKTPSAHGNISIRKDLGIGKVLGKLYWCDVTCCCNIIFWCNISYISVMSYDSGTPVLTMLGPY